MALPNLKVNREAYMAAKSLKLQRDPRLDAARNPHDRTRILLLLIAETIEQPGLLKNLARYYRWSPYTVSSWINQGYVPLRKAELLHENFSDKVSFELTDLCPARKQKLKPRGRNAHKNK